MSTFWKKTNGPGINRIKKQDIVVSPNNISNTVGGDVLIRHKPTDSKDVNNNDVWELEEQEKSKNRISVNEPISLSRMDKIQNILNQTNVDLIALQKLSWNGLNNAHRAIAWQLLLGYLSCNVDRRKSLLEKKRKEYLDAIQQHFSKGIEGLDYATYHQINIDMPRTNPDIPLFQHELVHRSLERILYCWAIRNAGCGYVQGINDVVAPFFSVFLSSYYKDLDSLDPSVIDPSILNEVEADCFGCLTKLLNGIQDNYTFSQPGIQRQVQKLKDLVGKIDGPLYNHLQEQNVEFLQFAFRWVNCLLIRELPLHLIIRMWDTYLSEQDGFSEFHIYVCAAFLIRFSEELRKKDFQDIILFLQSVPTKSWTDKDIEVLLSEAFMWKSLYQNSPRHLNQ